MTTTSHFVDLQIGIDEGLDELRKLAQYCRDTLEVDPGESMRTLEDLEGKITEAADLIHAHLTLFKRAARKAKQ